LESDATQTSECIDLSVAALWLTVGNLTTNYHLFRKDHAEKMREKDMRERERCESLMWGCASILMLCSHEHASVE
jgi:hypothetical protein